MEPIYQINELVEYSGLLIQAIVISRLVFVGIINRVVLVIDIHLSYSSKPFKSSGEVSDVFLLIWN